MVGLELPVLAMEHTYVITEPIDAITAHNESSGEELLGSIDFGGEIYTRQEGQGLLVGTYEQAAVAWQRHQTPWDFDKRLLTPDLDRIAPSLETAFRHFPVLADAGIARVVNGPFTFAPDGNPLVGPIRGLPNFWSACGVMAGLSQGGGVGLALANWMTTGDPGFDVWAMDVARFGDWATRSYTATKVRENYRRRFSISFPNEFLPEGRPLATTAIYEPQRAAGAVFGDAYGLEVPLWFAPEAGTAEDVTFGRSNAWPHVRAEVEAVRNDVGLMESSGFAKFLVEGPGARAWLTHLLAGRVPQPGRIALAPMCGENGNLAGDLTVACLPPARGAADGPASTVTGGATANTSGDERFVVFGSGIAERYYERWFDAHLARWRSGGGHGGTPSVGSSGEGPDAGTAARSSEGGAAPSPPVWYRTLGTSLCGLAIAGPKSRALLAEVTDADVSNEAMRFGSFSAIDVGWARAWCGRLSYTGDLGYELWMDASHLRYVYDLLVTHGAAHGLRLFGLHALNSLRLDKSFGSWAREYRPTYDPFEAGLGRFVRFTRANDDGADFVGRAALVAKYGPHGPDTAAELPAGTMSLRTWTLDGPTDSSGFDAAADEPIFCNGEPVGWVTSGGFAHHSNVSVAMGYVPAELAHDGTDFTIEIVGERRTGPSHRQLPVGSRRHLHAPLSQRGRSVEQGSADHHVLDLGGAVDVVGQAGGGEVAGQRMVTPTAHRAHHLHAVGQASLGDAGGELLGVRCVDCRGAAFGHRQRRPVGQQAGSLQVGRHVSQLEAHTLQVGNATAERLPLVGRSQWRWRGRCASCRSTWPPPALGRCRCPP